MNPLFLEDISNYNVFQLAAWIDKCRNAIKLSDKAVYQEDYSRYVYDVAEFCSEWEEHSKQYASVYKKDIYSDALYYLALKSPETYVIAGGAHIEISSHIYEMLQEDNLYCNTVQQVVRQEKKRIQDYSAKIKEIVESEKGRKRLHQFLHDIKCVTIQYEASILNSDGILHEGRPIYEVLPLLKKRKLNIRERKYCGTESTTFNDFVLSELKRENIGKNAYYAYVLPDKKTSVTQKAFFICMALFLRMRLDVAEQFLNTDGYTITKSKRDDDKIFRTCFELGFPLDYVNALLVGEGYPALDNSRKTK